MSISVKKQALFVFSGQALAAVGQAVIPMLLSRHFSKIEFGTYQQFTTLIQTILPVVTFGLNTSLLYFFPRAEGSKKNRMVIQTHLLLWGLGCCGMLTLLIFQAFFPATLSPIQGHTLILPFCTLVAVAAGIMDVIFIVEKRVQCSLWVPALEQIIKAGFVCFGGWTTQNAYGAVCGLTAFYALRCLAATGYVGVRYAPKLAAWPRNRQPILPLTDLKPIVAYVVPFGASISIRTIGQRVDRLLSISMLTQTQFAVYSVAFSTVPIFGLFLDSVFRVAVPRLSSLELCDNPSALRAAWKNMVSATLSMAIPLVVFAFVFAEEIITILFTKSFLAAVPVYRIYLIITFVTAFGPGLILRALHKTSKSFIANSVGALTSAAMAYPMIHSFGMTGAVLTAVTATMLPSVIQLEFERRAMHAGFSKWLPWRSFAIQFLLSGILAGLVKITLGGGWHPLFTALASFFLFVSLYGTIALTCRIGYWAEYTDRVKSFVFKPLRRLS